MVVHALEPRRAPRRVAKGFAFAAFACASIAAQASSAAAQVIQGTLHDLASKLPVAKATISILDADDSVLAVVITSDSGRFAVTMRKPGVFAIDAKRIGYAPLTTTSMALGAHDTLTIALDLSTVPVMLDPVHTKADQSFLTNVTPGHMVVAKHFALDKGIIVSGWAVEQSGMLLSEYLGHVAGLSLSGNVPRPDTPVVPGAHSTFLVSTFGSRCLYARIDHTPLLLMLIQNDAADIDQMLKVKDLMAVEVYHNVSEIPTEWRADAYMSDIYTRQTFPTPPTAKKVAEPTYTIGSNDVIPRTLLAEDEFHAAVLDNSKVIIPSCGFMQIWTKASW